MAKPMKQPARTSIKKAFRKKRSGSDDEGNIDEEEGENIVDEEADR